MSLKKIWTQHLKDNNMTYSQHMFFAAKHGIFCVAAGICLLIHSALPCFFIKAGSDLVIKLSNVFKGEK